MWCLTVNGEVSGLTPSSSSTTFAQPRGYQSVSQSGIPIVQSSISFSFFFINPVQAVGIARLLERRVREKKVASSIPGTRGGRSFFFFSLQSSLSVLTPIRCPFHLHVTALARKRTRSFCQKCRWHVTLAEPLWTDPVTKKSGISLCELTSSSIKTKNKTNKKSAGGE